MIETRVLENEVDTIRFETEPDGTPYKFDKVRFFIECPAKPGTQFSDSFIYINSAPSIYIGVYEFINSEQKNTSVFEISLDENKFIKCDRVASALGDISDTSPLINKDVGFKKTWHSVALTNIHRVRIDRRTVGSELPVGTVITIWGTRSVE